MVSTEKHIKERLRVAYEALNDVVHILRRETRNKSPVTASDPQVLSDLMQARRRVEAAMHVESFDAPAVLGVEIKPLPEVKTKADHQRWRQAERQLWGRRVKDPQAYVSDVYRKLIAEAAKTSIVEMEESRR